MTYASDDTHTEVLRLVAELPNLASLIVGFRRKHGADQVYEYTYAWNANDPAKLRFNDYSEVKPWDRGIAGYFHVLIMYATPDGTDDSDDNRRAVRRFRNALKRLTHDRYPVYVRIGPQAAETLL